LLIVVERAARRLAREEDGHPDQAAEETADPGWFVQVRWKTKGGFAMSQAHEVIDAMLESDGTLRLAHAPQLPAGPVRVIIQAVDPARPQQTQADVIRQIRADQIARGCHGLTAEQLRQREAALEAENDEYDREMERLGALPPPTSGAQ
jgi:hypothetical protein